VERRFYPMIVGSSPPVVAYLYTVLNKRGFSFGNEAFILIRFKAFSFFPRKVALKLGLTNVSLKLNDIWIEYLTLRPGMASFGQIKDHTLLTVPIQLCKPRT